MKLLALVPARGGSKRVPNKNIRELGGKPLIQWTLDAALGIPEIADVLVSTDSPEIAKIAKEAGALVPWLRPAELASDTATTLSVCRHALEWYEHHNGSVDAILLLQPTSPFRTQESIVRAIDLFRVHPERSIVSFSSAESHPLWCYRIQEDMVQPFVEGSQKPTRSQDLPSVYVINGAIYIASPAYLNQHGSFIGRDTVPLIMEDMNESLDIDTEMDWNFAQFLTEP
jgi:CMP-N,N'-diacetyllegionaminic acid synthase